MAGAGDVVDHRFELQSELRGGGMGRIFRAVDRHTGALVAVKVAIEADGDTGARFRREAVLLAELAHPAIVAYVAHGELADRRPYLVMEWLDGADLGLILEASVTPPPVTVKTKPGELARIEPFDKPCGRGIDVATAVLVAKRIAAALSALHARGVVHRDIKPGNLFLPQRDPAQTKLLDFGTARERLPAHPVTTEGTLIGTPYYMAPEQVREGGSIGPAADVWAVGCVLYECLTGRAPFFASHPLAALARIMIEDPTPVADLRIDIPDDLALLLRDMLAKDYAARPPDGAALLSRLEALALADGPRTPLAREARTLTGSESRVCALLFARASTPKEPERAIGRVAARAATNNDIAIGRAATRAADGDIAIGRAATRASDGEIALGRAPTRASDAGIALGRAPTRASDGDLASHAIVRAGSGEIALGRADATRGDAAASGALATGRAGSGDVGEVAIDSAGSGDIAIGRAGSGEITQVREIAIGRADSGNIAVGRPGSGEITQVRDIAVGRASSSDIVREQGAAIANVVALRRAVTAQGGTFQALADAETSFLVTIESVNAPTDQAAAAARIALALRDVDPEIRQVLVTGRGDGGHAPMGQLVDSAVDKLLVARPGDIRLDRLTASLIDARFHVVDSLLAGERDAEGTRTLLGKPSLWVGRRRELATLLATLDECAEERVSRAVLVLAQPGMGKSRLRHELTRSLERRGMSPGVLVLYGQGDSLSAGSPFVMIAPALRRAAGILDGEPLERRREKLALLVDANLPVADRRRVTEFLGELVGVAFPDDTSELLRSARADKMLLGQHMERAWVDWLRATTQHQPVLLVLEDLHWGDLPSINYVDAALRALPDAPLMVLALARPEVRQLFPRLWEHREPEELALHALSTAACSELVRAALGAEATPTLVEELVRRCDGNAFYLEELVRAVADGDNLQTLPETVIGMVQARLAGLESPARRVLRAAAVFGEAFWDGGVIALLGSDQPVKASEWLEDLTRREVISKNPISRLPDQSEYTFRHALLRDGAYELLTDADRTLGHRLAASWLVRAGELDGLVLASHFMRGGDHERAVHWYRRAAEQALEGNDLAGVIERADCAIKAGASGELLGELLGLQANAAYWSSRYADGRQWGEQASKHIPAGRASWFVALASALVSAARLGDYETVDRLFATVLAVQPVGGLDDLESQRQVQIGMRPPKAEAAQLICLARGTFQLIFAGRFERADQILVEIASLASRAVDLDALTYAQVNHVQGVRAAHVGDVAVFLRHLLAAVDGFERAGDTRNLSLERTTVAWCWAELGSLARAEDECRASLASCLALRAPQATTYAHVNLGYILTQPGKLGEAKELLARAISECQAVSNPRLEGWARAHLTAIHDLVGDHAAGLAEAERAVVLLDVSPGLKAWALATRSRALLALGRDAIADARAAMQILERLGGLLQGESLPPLALARALHAAGDHAGARAAIADARVRLLRRAERLGDAKQTFLALPDNALTLQLAAKWT